jgi:hypothetical protein
MPLPPGIRPINGGTLFINPQSHKIMNQLLQTTPQTTGAELQAAGAAALQKATIEAKFTIALHNKRNVMDARSKLMEACRRPKFAEAALYSKPVGGRRIEGRSIRFAEAAIQMWGNIDISASTVWENEHQRLVKINVTDLETNTSYGDEILLNKTVERKFLKEGQYAISERLNSNNEKVYLVAATEDDLQNKLNSAKSKSIRNSGLRLIPEDIQEECTEVIRKTLAEGGGETPADRIKKICDAFQELGVKASDLEVYLEHSIDSVSPSELADLRTIYNTIRSGESKWSQYVESKINNTQGTAAPKPPEFTERPADKVIDLEPKTPQAEPEDSNPELEAQEPPKQEASPQPLSWAVWSKNYGNLGFVQKHDLYLSDQNHAFLQNCHEKGLTPAKAAKALLAAQEDKSTTTQAQESQPEPTQDEAKEATVDNTAKFEELCASANLNPKQVLRFAEIIDSADAGIEVVYNTFSSLHSDNQANLLNTLSNPPQGFIDKVNATQI